MSNRPTGTVTLLFTDIEGSTKLAQQYPDPMPELLAWLMSVGHCGQILVSLTTQELDCTISVNDD